MRSRVLIGCGTVTSLVFTKLTSVLGDDFKDDFKPEDIKNGDGNLLDPVIKQVDQIGTSGYKLLKRVGIYSGVLAIMTAFIFFGWARNSMKQSEHKTAIMVAFVSVIGVLTAVSAVSLIYSIVEGE